jgi:hypothetical protein
VKTDNPADNLRSKMVETDVLAHLVHLLQYEDLEERWSSVKIITALAKFGRLIYHFVLCED